MHPVVITMVKQPETIDFAGFCPLKWAIFPLIFVLHVVIVMGNGVKNGKIFIMRFLRDANML